MNLLSPRWHGNGFIQVYLNSVTRLHIWSPEFQSSVKNARIHDHRFVFRSSVLMGGIRHIEYEWWKTHRDGDYAMWATFCGTGERAREPKLDEFNSQGKVKKLCDETYVAGQEYTFGHPFRFHDTIPLTTVLPTVTLMTKERRYEGHLARILVPIGETPDHALDPSDAPSELQMRREVSSVLRLLDGVLGAPGAS